MTKRLTNAVVDPTKEIKVANTTGASIAVLMPTLGAPVQPGNGVQVYDQDLELMESTDGSFTIADGASATFVLDQTYVDPDTKKVEYSTVYDLLVSSASWYSPVDNLGVMQSFDTPPSYPDQAVTKASAAALANAAQFVQTISAYPTSQLTQDYQAALKGAVKAGGTAADGSPGSSEAVSGAIDGGVATFFKGTKTYKDVTLAGVVATQNYYDSFPFVWAQYATTSPTTTYYLYSSDGKTTSFVGTIGLTKPTTIDLTVVNGGYTCTFTPASNPSDTTTVAVDASKSTSLTYSDGLFVDDVNSDVPQIAVKGTFQVKRLFTATPTDTQVITVLTGTIDGAVSIGFDSPQKKDDPANSAFWNALFHPKNSSQIFQSIMTIGGAVMLLAFVGTTAYSIYKWARGLAGAKEPTTAQLLQKQQDDLGKMMQDKIDAAVKKMSNGQDQAPSDADAAATEITEATQSVVDNQNAGRLSDGFEAQADSLQELALYESSMSQQQLLELEAQGTAVQDGAKALDNATQDQLGDVVTAQTTALGDVQSGVSTLTTELSSEVSSQSAADIAANDTLATEAANDVADAEANADGDTTDGDPVADDPIFPEL